MSDTIQLDRSSPITGSFGLWNPPFLGREGGGGGGLYLQVRDLLGPHGVAEPKSGSMRDWVPSAVPPSSQQGRHFLCLKMTIVHLLPSCLAAAFRHRGDGSQRIPPLCIGTSMIHIHHLRNSRQPRTLSSPHFHHSSILFSNWQSSGGWAAARLHTHASRYHKRISALGAACPATLLLN